MKAPTKWQLADLSLFLATPEQTVESRKRSAQEWRRALTEEQYILRDIIMDEHEHAAHGKGATWSAYPLYRNRTKADTGLQGSRTQG